MVLQDLILHNFCLYHGSQVLDLTPTRSRGKQQPIILFGGINGGGKTTLLDAVQLVLYGKRARCSKRNGKSYEQFLRESIHHGVDPEEGAAISLRFMYGSDGRNSEYEVTRSWSFVRGRLRETVEVQKDGDYDQWLSEHWNQVVEELIPHGIARLCFFDAEQIRFLAEDESSSRTLGDAIKSLLGLDLAERLVADAAALESRISKKAAKSEELEAVEALERELEESQAEVDRLVQETASLENPRQKAKQRLKRAEDKFSRVGGRHWEEHDERRQRKGELEGTISHLTSRLIALSTTEAPLALTTDLLSAVSDQDTRERTAAEAEVVGRLLLDRDRQLISTIESVVPADAVDVVRSRLDEDRERRAAVGDCDRRLALSDEGRRIIDRLLQGGLAERKNECVNVLAQFSNARRELETVERGLSATPDESTIRDVAEELKAASRDLAELDQQIARLQKQLDSARFLRDERSNKFGRLRRKVVDEHLIGEENRRIAGLLVRTQETMQEFLNRATATKIDRLSQLVTESLRFLLRKQSLVDRVQIDPETFAITLYDVEGNAIPKERLSEGEKQIFAISVLWGLSRASGRPLPAIIDTPMGRLDSEHRNQLVSRYFPNASHQVIVLSTDTEVERGYFEELQPHVAKAYHLDYDEDTRTTTVEEGYFWSMDDAELEEVAT